MRAGRLFCASKPRMSIWGEFVAFNLLQENDSARCFKVFIVLKTMKCYCILYVSVVQRQDWSPTTSRKISCILYHFFSKIIKTGVILLPFSLLFSTCFLRNFRFTSALNQNCALDFCGVFWRRDGGSFFRNTFSRVIHFSLITRLVKTGRYSFIQTSLLVDEVHVLD